MIAPGTLAAYTERLALRNGALSTTLVLAGNTEAESPALSLSKSNPNDAGSLTFDHARLYASGLGNWAYNLNSIKSNLLIFRRDDDSGAPALQGFSDYMYCEGWL